MIKSLILASTSPTKFIFSPGDNGGVIIKKNSNQYSYIFLNLLIETIFLESEIFYGNLNVLLHC